MAAPPAETRPAWEGHSESDRRPLTGNMTQAGTGRPPPLYKRGMNDLFKASGSEGLSAVSRGLLTSPGYGISGHTAIPA